eukprot:226226_1
MLAKKSFCNLTCLLTVALLCCILGTIMQEMILPTHWIWPTIYYFIHSKVVINGCLTIIDKTNPSADKIYTYGNSSTTPHTTITITDPRYFHHVVKDIDVGLGESYVLNYWQTDDIAQYLRLLFINYNNQQ